MSIVLVPKRKLITNTPMDEAVEAIYSHTIETVISEISYGYRSVNRSGSFDWELKIPVGTDMYPGGH